MDSARANIDAATGGLQNFQSWVLKSPAGPLVSAVCVVVGLGSFKATRPYAVPIGVLIIALWYLKWRKKN